MVPLSLPVPDLTADLKGLLMILNGFLHLAKGHVGVTQVAKKRPFIVSVVGFLCRLYSHFKRRLPLRPVTPDIQIVSHRPNQILCRLPFTSIPATFHHFHDVRPVEIKPVITFKTLFAILIGKRLVVSRKPSDNRIIRLKPFTGVGVDQGVTDFVVVSETIQKTIKNQLIQRFPYLFLLKRSRDYFPAERRKSK